jgi:hypothetical protein
VVSRIKARENASRRMRRMRMAGKLMVGVLSFDISAFYAAVPTGCLSGRCFLFKCGEGRGVHCMLARTFGKRLD